MTLGGVWHRTDDLAVDVSHMSCPDPDNMRRYAICIYIDMYIYL